MRLAQQRLYSVRQFPVWEALLSTDLAEVFAVLLASFVRMIVHCTRHKRPKPDGLVSVSVGVLCLVCPCKTPVPILSFAVLSLPHHNLLY